MAQGAFTTGPVTKAIAAVRGAAEPITLSVTDIDTDVNCEPRILDIVLGRHLGMAQPLNIRPMIEANTEELAGYGEVFTRDVKTSAKGGRLGKAVYLNEGQALCICALSRAPKAPPVRRALIEAFMELRRRALPASAANVEVKAYRRSPPCRRPPSRLQAGRGYMVLEGEGVVWFDRRYLPRPGDTVLAINHDGQPVVAPVADRPEAEFRPGRVWIEQWPRPMRTWEHMTLIGIVSTPAGRLMRGVELRNPAFG